MGGYAGLAPAGFPNVALSNFAKEFADDEVPLVGDMVCPKVPVDRQSFPYVIWDRQNLQLPGSTLRAPGGRPGTIRRSFSTDTYFARDHSLESFIPFESEAYALGLGFSEKAHLTGDIIGRIRRARENDIATMVLSTTNFPNGVTLSGSSMWDSYITTPANDTTATVTSHPINDVETAKETLRQAAVPDNLMVLILSSPVVRVLVNHPDIVERFKYTNTTGIIDLDRLSSVFGVKCVRAGALSASQTMGLSWIWGNNAFLGYSKPNPDRNDVSCAKTFVWAGGKGPGPDGSTMEYAGAPGTIDGYGVLEWIEPHLSEKKYWQSVHWYYDLKVTAQETGYPLLNAVSGDTMEILASLAEG
jgi:hypothetical protein